MSKHSVDVIVSAKDRASGVFRKIAYAAGAYLSFRAIAGGISASIKAFIAQEKATQQLESALRATGNAAGLSARYLQEHADSLQKTTIYGDEAIEGAMSLLATFKEIKGDTFKGATAAILDMSYAMGQDLKSSVVQVGKALNDPIRGVSALGRVGVTFSEQQKDQIKNFAQTNNLAAAQAIILKELNSQFGGQATAAANTFGGSIIQLKNAFGDGLEKMGQMIANIPGFQKSIKVATVLIANFDDVMQLTWTSTAFGLVSFWEDLKHTFTVKIPGVLKWLSDNWAQIFLNLYNGTATIFKNMGTNLKEFMGAVWSFLKGDGFDFQWTGLLDGFTSTLQEMPKIAAREMGPVEQALAAEILEIKGRLGKEISDKLTPAAAVAAGNAIAGTAGPGAASGKGSNAGKSGALYSRTLSILPGSGLSNAEKAQIDTAKSNNKIVALLETLTEGMRPGDAKRAKIGFTRFA